MKLGIQDPKLWAFDYFLVLYTNKIPIRFSVRILDIFLNEGEKILYRVGLLKLKLIGGGSAARRGDCPAPEPPPPPLHRVKVLLLVLAQSLWEPERPSTQPREPVQSVASNQASELVAFELHN